VLSHWIVRWSLRIKYKYKLKNLNCFALLGWDKLVQYRLTKSRALKVYGYNRLLLPWLRVPCRLLLQSLHWKIAGRFEDWTRTTLDLSSESGTHDLSATVTRPLRYKNLLCLIKAAFKQQFSFSFMQSPIGIHSNFQTLFIAAFKTQPFAFWWTGKTINAYILKKKKEFKVTFYILSGRNDVLEDQVNFLFFYQACISRSPHPQPVCEP